MPIESRTYVRNACGHLYPYRVKRQGAIRWLEQQVCPRCRAGARARKSQPQVPPRPDVAQQQVLLEPGVLPAPPAKR